MSYTTFDNISYGLENLTIEDVDGEYNPKLIGIEYGLLTHNETFLRQARVLRRKNRLMIALEYYVAAYDRLPGSFQELDASGFFPIRPTDPVTFETVRYGNLPESEQDYLNFGITANEETWILDYLVINFPDGPWERKEETITKYSLNTGYIETHRHYYPNLVALRGACLSYFLNDALLDYESRRNSMPDSAEELLDDLHSVSSSWAINDPTVDMSQPGYFMFGLDQNLEMAIAKWRDGAGQAYMASWQYSPWPQGGWDFVPSFEYLMFRQNENGYGNEISQGLDHNPEEQIPELILWRCTLINGD